MREKFVTLARSFLGATERDGSHREIIDIYNRISPLPRGYRMGYNDPWCAAFVSAVGELGGMGAVILPECACEAMIKLYKARGRFSEAEPENLRPGDIVMYDWGGDRVADHVGIIEEAGEKLKVIEGNMSNCVGYRLLARNSPNIRGYCLPEFDTPCHSEGHRPEESNETLHFVQSDKGEEFNETQNEVQSDKGDKCHSERSEESHSQSYPFSLPLLSLGSRSEAVRSAQLLLIGRGSRCGPWGADADFGPGTYGAVLRYQQLHHLQPDGVIGNETWQSLLGL